MVFVPKKDHNLPEVMNAKQKELQLFKDYQVYRTVPDNSRISSGWIVTRKEIQVKPGIKARLVCHGNQVSLMHENINQRSDSRLSRNPVLDSCCFLHHNLGGKSKPKM